VALASKAACILHLGSKITGLGPQSAGLKSISDTLWCTNGCKSQQYKPMDDHDALELSAVAVLTEAVTESSVG